MGCEEFSRQKQDKRNWDRCERNHGRVASVLIFLFCFKWWHSYQSTHNRAGGHMWRHDFVFAWKDVDLSSLSPQHWAIALQFLWSKGYAYGKVDCHRHIHLSSSFIDHEFLYITILLNTGVRWGVTFSYKYKISTHIKDF